MADMEHKTDVASNGDLPEGCTHDCGSCGFNCGARAVPQKYEPHAGTNIKKIIAVVSGKGGVGKSAVTCMLAHKLNSLGKKVCILDADVTGPSIPKAFGVTEHPTGSMAGFVPVSTKSGIDMMSLNLLLENEEMPVAWRGPMIGSLIKQFYEDVMWGDVDVMLIDMPPGTSDVFLTIMQMIPVDGIVTVSAPQELVHMIVGKAVILAKELNVPVVGLVENMAYFTCKHCGEKQFLFGKPSGVEAAKKFDIPHVAEMPIDPEFRECVDAGNVEAFDVGDVLDDIIAGVLE